MSTLEAEALKLACGAESTESESLERELEIVQQSGGYGLESDRLDLESKRDFG